MLQYLKIRDLALLESATLDFAAGFTAVTGETGAGKSVLLGALSLLSGARAEKSVVRKGADATEVEAALYFEDSRVVDLRLEALGLPACEDGVLLLQRKIPRSGMPRVSVNGQLTTLTNLKTLGEAWIDFHGPGEPQKLFQERRQLELLDAYAGISDRLAEYGERYREWRAALAEIEALESGERLDPDEIDFVRQQIDRIDRVEVSEASIADLERDFARLSRAQEVLLIAASVADAVSGEDGLGDRLSAVAQQLDRISDLDTEVAAIAERAHSLTIELEDIAAEMERLARDADFDPEAVEALNDRMSGWQDLKRKYGGSVAAVLAKRAELERRIGVQGDLDAVLRDKRQAAEAIESDLRARAAKLRKARATASTALSEGAANMLRQLGFKKARVAIELVDTGALRDFGDCACRFQFAPNAGQDLMPLNKIASSGETARVMLALKTLLAEADATPLLVFDEVDANVGGEVGRSVGGELARLSGRHQVLCVTHLPQVAALAHHHLNVVKLQDETNTTVSIHPLPVGSQERIDELARMLGDRSSASARAHARELLGESGGAR